jgi:hypothetical protein
MDFQQIKQMLSIKPKIKYTKQVKRNKYIFQILAISFAKVIDKLDESIIPIILENVNKTWLCIFLFEQIDASSKVFDFVVNELYRTVFYTTLRTSGLWTLLSRRLVVATTIKPRLGHLAPASEVAGGHTIPF